MKLDAYEQKMGYIWFFASGTFALVLAAGLFCVDNRLSTSTGEKEKGELIGSVRRAQTGLASHTTDDRQNQSAVYNLRIETNNAADVETDSSHAEE